MRIAYATIYDLEDVNRGSGTYHSLYKEMQRQGVNVLPIGPLHIEWSLMTRAFRYLSTRILGSRYRSFQDPFSARSLAQKAYEKLRGLDYDLLLTNDYSIAAYIKTTRPIIIYTDAMFPSNYGSNINPRLTNLSPISVAFCQLIQRRGLERCDHLVFPCQWICREAEEGWGIPKEKISIIPFGANVADPTDKPTLRRSTNQLANKKPVQVLFVGKDWERKGGEIAISAVNTLNQRGIHTVLHVVGSQPPNDVDSEIIRVHGYLSKAKKKQRDHLDRLYRESDVFILPSSAEGYVISVLEAAAYGLPVVAYDTDGVREPVANGISGTLLPLGTSADCFADVIETWIHQADHYRRLVLGSRDHFEKSANWQTCTANLCQLVDELLHKSS